jgi:hypothetical protein
MLSSRAVQHNDVIFGRRRILLHGW